MSKNKEREREANQKNDTGKYFRQLAPQHTVIFGCPGAGKNLLAKILASIWRHTGLLKMSRTDKGKTSSNDVDGEDKWEFSHFPPGFSPNHFFIAIYYTLLLELA